MDQLPAPRGPVSEVLLENLRSEPHALSVGAPSGEPLDDDDLHLSLYLCYELHYRGLPGVDERWEWEPSLLAVRAELERRFERGLLDAVPRTEDAIEPGDVDLALRAIADDEQGPSLSSYVRTKATLAQVREFVVHRSAYQLK